MSAVAAAFTSRALSAYARRVWDNGIVPYRFSWFAAVASLVLLAQFFMVAINVSKSLPERVFIIGKWDSQPRRGEYMQFAWNGADPYPAGLQFVKVIRGVPGDVVSWSGRKVYINGEFVAEAKTHSSTGKPLRPGPSGEIPPGHYFVFAPHPDSLDSRYENTGWIESSRFRGRVILAW